MRTKSLCILNKFALLAGTAGLALTLALGGHSMAQTNSGSSGAGHDSGTSHESGAGHDSGSSHEGGSGGKKMRKGASGERGGGHGGSLRDVFKQMEVEEALDEVRGQRRGQSDQSQRGGQAAADKGQQGAKKSEPQDAAEAPEDPGSKPGQAGGHGGGEKQDYGDLYIVVRDADGVPILVPPVDANGDPIMIDTNEDGVPDAPAPDQKQVYYIDANGDLQCCLPYTVDTEGDLELDTALGEPSEAIFSRTSVVRSPDWVLEAQYLEFIKLLEAADSVEVDQTDRIVLKTEEADGTTTETSIDSPLIYLALYLETLTEGTLDVAKERNDDPYDTDYAALLEKLPVELAALKDGIYTVDDRTLSAIFLAAAMDKGGTATADMIVYLNAQLDVATADNYVSADESEYVKYSDYTYDRAEVYADSQITVLVPDGVDGEGNPQYVTKTVDVLGTVFPDDLEELTGIAAYTQAVDDARAVIDYVHTFSPPETN